MSGLYEKFYKGNLSELLADYLLSNIGISTPVRRQFDNGVDFYCNLMDNESGYLTFRYPFSIQIKSSSIKHVHYGNKDSKKWRKENIQSLFHSEVPFFIGLVDKKKTSISIYDTTGLWQLFKDGKTNCSQVILRPSQKNVGEERNNHIEQILDGWDKNKGDGIRYIIDLGNPIIDITENDIHDKVVLEGKKNILRAVIATEKRNIVFRSLGVKCFQEIKENQTNIPSFYQGMHFRGDFDNNYLDSLYNSLRIPLISLLINTYTRNELEKCDAIKSILRYIPDDGSYKQLKKGNPQLFDWIAE